MEKLLVEVYVPALMTSYDLFIPFNIQMAVVQDLVQKAVMKISDGMFIPSDTTVICDFETGRILDINKSAEELEIFNGSRLMLI